MMLVNKFRETCFVSMSNDSLLDISFFCLLFDVACLSSYKSGEKLETSMHILAHERCACTANKSSSRCAGKYGWTMAKQRIGRWLNILASSSHTSLWYVRQDPDGSCCAKTALLIECSSDRWVIAVSQGLNFKSRDRLSALEPSDVWVFTSLFTILRSLLWICILGYQLPVQYQVTRSKILHHNSSPHHNQSRQESDAARCNKDEMCFHRDTARGFGSISVRNTLRAKAPTEGTENTCGDFKFTRSADAAWAFHVSPSNCASWSSCQDTCNKEPMSELVYNCWLWSTKICHRELM